MTTSEAKEHFIKELQSSGLAQKEWYRTIYLKSDHWKALRKEALDLHGHHCAKCDATKRLDVHHLTYRWIYDVTPQDLQILCRPCHNQEHPKKEKPLQVCHRKKKQTTRSKRPKKEKKVPLSPINWQSVYQMMMKSAKRKDDPLLEARVIKKLLRKHGQRIPRGDREMLQRKRLKIRKDHRANVPRKPKKRHQRNLLAEAERMVWDLNSQFFRKTA